MVADNIITFPLDFEISQNLLLGIARFFSHQEGCGLLYSGGEYDSARVSYLFLFSQKKFVLKPPYYCDPWDQLEEEFSKNPLKNAFWVGYLGYELGAFADREVQLPVYPSCQPQALFYKASLILKVDHHIKQGTVTINHDFSVLNVDDAFWLKKLANNQGWLELKSLINPTHLPMFHSTIIQRSDSLQSYAQKIRRIKEEIAEGNVYQLNLSQEWKIHTSNMKCSFEIFEKVVQENPAAFMAFLQTGEFSIVSSSPERFLKRQDGVLETMPIKGTMPRGKNDTEDKVNRFSLLTSEKENAELLMITDLMRNDLGKISSPGTVETIKLCHCEAYTNVYHLNSLIRAKALPISPFAALREVFPGGSISGCPKISAMKLIHNLEGRARGIYTGSIGFLNSEGDFDFNIAIRTLIVYSDSHIQLQLGGGIVIDSEPEKEYEETLHKGHTLFKVLGIKDSDARRDYGDRIF